MRRVTIRPRPRGGPHPATRRAALRQRHTRPLLSRLRAAVLPASQRRTLDELTEDLDLRSGDVRSKQSAFWTMLVLAGAAAVVILIGVAAAVLVPGTVDLQTNSQITSRTSPTVVDLVAAVATAGSPGGGLSPARCSSRRSATPRRLMPRPDGSAPSGARRSPSRSASSPC